MDGALAQALIAALMGGEQESMESPQEDVIGLIRAFLQGRSPQEEMGEMGGGMHDWQMCGPEMGAPSNFSSGYSGPTSQGGGFPQQSRSSPPQSQPRPSGNTGLNHVGSKPTWHSATGGREPWTLTGPKGGGFGK